MVKSSTGISRIFRYTTQIYNHKSKKQAALYLVRSSFFFKQTKLWLDYISLNHLLVENDDTHLELAAKIYRPFLRTSYSLAERISLLKNHFDITTQYFPPSLVSAILGKQEVELFRLEGKKENLPYILTISRNMKFDKEGELTIALRAENSVIPLASVSFIFGYGSDGSIIAIVGGLQGPTPAGEENKRNVIKATKDLNGLRPKRAVIEALCSMARHIGATSIHSPSNMAHISKSLAKKKQMIYSDYDQFWAELGGVVSEDNTYAIPVTLPQRSIEEVPAKKRKDWLVRTEHLNNISLLVSTVFSRFA